MKIILSRKGFDSSAGGVPSPILPDGRIVALPIPDPRSPVRYGEIGQGGNSDNGRRDIGALVSNLTGGRIRRSSRAHLDPDLVAADRPRPPGWRPLFGQEGAAQGHLRNQGVGTGDLFVFFGLFQLVIRRRGRFVFDRQAPRVHLIWGWLQVERVVPVGQCPDAIRRWASAHPHFHHDPSAHNVLYVARERLCLPGLASTELPGSGVFAHHRRLLRLTEPGSRLPSRWRLPGWMHPSLKRPAMSYHHSPGRWSRSNGVVRLSSTARGQEFVLEGKDYPEASLWIQALIRQAARGTCRSKRMD